MNLELFVSFNFAEINAKMNETGRKTRVSKCAHSNLMLKDLK